MTEPMRRALLVGIDDYTVLPPLDSSVADARDLCKMLETNEDGSANYACKLLLSSTEDRITPEILHAKCLDLFRESNDDILFYFSGHGALIPSGASLVTQDGTRLSPGFPMIDLLSLASQSKARSVLLILDCCHSGNLGDAPRFHKDLSLRSQAQLLEGLTILAGSRATEPAFQGGGHSVFTELVLGALNGGAADVRGLVSAASIYGYVEQILGPWDQRPLYKSHADRLPPVRRCRAAVDDSLLRELPDLFKTPESLLPMDPSYEHTEKSHLKEHVALFDKFKMLRDARLLVTTERKDLYYTALEKGHVQLTPLGQFYWRLANKKRI